MYLTPTENHWACDLEADNLLDEATKIWCVTLENVITGETFSTTTADSFLVWLEDHPTALFVGHNFLAYDTVMLNRFWKAGIGVKRVVDTFVLSQVYNPSYPKPQGLTGKKGPHSLEAWGIRLKYPKGDFDDFSAFSEEMLKYCANDTSLTALLYRKLSERMRQVGFTETGIEIEHLAWNIIQNKQRRNGFPFNKQKAEELYVTLRHREEELQREIYKLWPPRLEVVGSYRKPFKQNGEPSVNYARHCEQFPEVRLTADGYDAYDYVAFNLGSPPQRIEKLLELGWKPVSFTKKTKKGGGGNPKVDEDSLVAFAETSGKTELLALSKWVVINSRANMINTWLEAYNEKTGCIHGKLFIASTLRYKHNSPNSANIPAVRLKKDDNGDEHIQYGEAGFWTYESRDLFDCGNPDEWSLVGIDGTGIQNRCLNHHLIATVGPERVAPFTELSLRGDIHKHNINVLGLANKAAAKKFYYCVPLDTKALTKRGWKNYDEVEIGELVLTFNAEKRIKEWKPVLAKVYFDDAPVVEMGHKNSFRVRSTPNHRWFTQQRKVKTKWADTPIEIRTTEELTTMQNIIVNAPMVGDEESCGYDWTQLPKYETDWVNVVLEMSHQERRAFLAGFCIADGHTNTNSNWVWSQNRGNLFEAALLASYLCTSSKLYVSDRQQENGNVMATVILGAKPHTTTAFMEYKQLPNQPVWCIRTENESWVIRQGDTITITGNTLMMGGGGGRLAADQLQFGTKLTAKEGEGLKAKIVQSIPGFGDLINKLEKDLERTGRITLCDGTPILVPSPHMVIPYLLQGDESRLMKKAMIFMDEEIRRHKLTDVILKVADIHDEHQWRVRNEHVQRFVELALPCFIRAGEFFNYNVPIEGDYKVGKTWAETH